MCQNILILDISSFKIIVKIQPYSPDQSFYVKSTEQLVSFCLFKAKFLKRVTRAKAFRS